MNLVFYIALAVLAQEYDEEGGLGLEVASTKSKKSKKVDDECKNLYHDHSDETSQESMKNCTDAMAAFEQCSQALEGQQANPHLKHVCKSLEHEKSMACIDAKISSKNTEIYNRFMESCEQAVNRCNRKLKFGQELEGQKNHLACVTAEVDHLLQHAQKSRAEAAKSLKVEKLTVELELARMRNEVLAAVENVKTQKEMDGLLNTIEPQLSRVVKKVNHFEKREHKGEAWDPLEMPVVNEKAIAREATRFHKKLKGQLDKDGVSEEEQKKMAMSLAKVSAQRKLKRKPKKESQETVKLTRAHFIPNEGNDAEDAADAEDEKAGSPNLVLN